MPNNISETERGLAAQVTLQFPRGLHARPSARTAQLAAKFQSDILLISESSEVDAKSMLDILSLACKKGDKLIILAKGADAEQAVSELADYLSGAQF